MTDAITGHDSGGATQTAEGVCARYSAVASAAEREAALRQVRRRLEGVGTASAPPEQIAAAWRAHVDCLGQPHVEALASLGHAWACLVAHDGGRARKHASGAIEAAAGITDDAARGVVSCLARLADAQGLLEAQAASAAADKLQAAAEQCAATGLSAIIAERLHLLGLARRRLGESKAARDALQEALARFEELGDAVAAARVHDTLGMVYIDAGVFDDAVFHLQQSLAHKSVAGDTRGLAMTAGNLGRLYLQWEEYERAREFLEQDLAISQRLDDETGQLVALNDLVESLVGMGDLRQARRRLDEADKLCQLVNTPFSVGNTRYSAAFVLLAEGNADAAMEYHQMARRAFGEIPAPVVGAHLDLQLGAIEAARSNFGLARERLDAAIRTFDELHQPGRLARARFEHAMALMHEGATAEALGCLAEAMNGARELSARRMGERFQETCNQVSSETLMKALWEMRQRAVGLHEASAAQEREMRQIVHDVRNPIGAVQGALDTALLLKPGDPMDEQIVETLRRGRRQSEWMLELISSVLDVSRTQAGRTKMASERVRLLEIAREMVEWFGPEAMGQNMLLAIDPTSEDAAAQADTSACRRILMNLVRNAIKYGRPPTGAAQGRITIRVERHGQDARVRVCNTGPAIPAELQSRIFQPFGADSAEMAKYSSGLGLSYCKAAVEAQGGLIGVEISPGEGTTFRFALPGVHA